MPGDRKCPRRAGRSRRWPEPGRSHWAGRVRVRAISSTSRGLPHGTPGARLAESAAGCAWRCARGAARSGGARSRRWRSGPALVEINYGQQAAGRHQDARHAPARTATTHHDDQPEWHCASSTAHRIHVRDEVLMPSPGGRSPGWPTWRGEWRVKWWRQGAASRRPPRGLPHDGPGQSCTRYAHDTPRAAPGPPRGRAMPGRRDAARAPARSRRHGPTSMNTVDLPAPVSDYLSDNHPDGTRISPDADGRATSTYALLGGGGRDAGNRWVLQPSRVQIPHPPPRRHADDQQQRWIP